jgi:hypothetical protein
MSIASLLGLAERLFNGVDSTSAAPQRPHHHHHQDRQQGASNAREQDSGNGDRFTPSSTANASNATDNVIALQFERLRFSTFNITATPDATPAATGGTLTTTGATAPAANSNTATANVPAAVPEAGLPQTTTPAAQAGAAATTTTTNTEQGLLQSLNAQLTALGLSPAEIQGFDEAAKLIQQFSPAAFQDLVNQLKALAEQFASQASPAATTGAGATAGAGATVGNATGGFTLTELSLRFTGVNETIQSSGQGGTGATTQISAYKLQLQEVQVSLNSQTGQTVQIQAPQQAAKSQTVSAG